RGGVVPDEHGREADMAEPGDFGRHLGANFLRERLPVDDGRRHGVEVT
ncbi:MAG: hypothetical protein QOI27_2542, partial [Gaiellaceae bacterium]|nr:hypothetical protein [Gaiellaceae bacterium]